jgi:hypothetical protein
MKDDINIDEYGTKRWYFAGQLHRDDGPAVEYASGGKEWWINGNLHREDGPAIETWIGTKEWWLHGVKHREDGPAVERWDGNKEWWLKHKRFRTKETWFKALNKKLKMKALFSDAFWFQYNERRKI